MSRATATSGQSPKAQMDLRVFSGIHAGAEVRLPERGILMIGQSDDCDLIISDPGIADHHCVLTVVGDQVLLRALDGQVDVEGENGKVRGENVTLDHFSMVHLGEHASLAVGAHWSEQWQKLVDAAAGDGSGGDHAAGGNRRVLLVAGLLLVVAALVLIGGWRLMQDRPSAVHEVEKQMTEARHILDAMSLTAHVKVSNDAGGTLVLNGVVGTPEQLQELKSKLTEAGLTPEMHVRDWPSVAEAVKTIFSMHRHEVKVELMKDRSKILVYGHFGGRKLSEIEQRIFGSDDMQNLSKATGGLKAHIVDYDARDEPPPEPDPGKVVQNVRLDTDGMPYIVTRDGSRYYPGGELPPFGTFIGGYPDDLTILVKTADNGIMQLSKRTNYRKLEREDTHAGHLMPATASSLSSMMQPVPLGHAFGADARTPTATESPAESSHVH